MPEMTVRGNTLAGSVREELEESATGEMRILSDKGDTQVTWNPRDEHEVKAAKKQFKSLTGKGFIAWRVGESGSREQIREFDPEAQKMVLAPALAGGC